MIVPNKEARKQTSIEHAGLPSRQEILIVLRTLIDTIADVQQSMPQLSVSQDSRQRPTVPGAFHRIPGAVGVLATAVCKLPGGGGRVPSPF
jgi:hypothetical protein